MSHLSQVFPQRFPRDRPRLAPMVGAEGVEDKIGGGHRRRAIPQVLTFKQTPVSFSPKSNLSHFLQGFFLTMLGM